MIKYLSILLILLKVIAQNPQPYPTCAALPGIYDIPVTIQQTQMFNMDDLFKGFNLDIQLSKNAPSFAYLRDKFVQKMQTKMDLRGIRNYHLDHVDNSWGKNFIVITETNYTTKIKWGTLAAADTVPNIVADVIVEQQQNVFCYDAVLFTQQKIALVDCASRTSNAPYIYSNRFYYVDLETKKVLPGFLKNQLYVPYTLIRFRRFFKYTQNGYHYLMRAYYADAVDVDKRDNTYLQVYSINNPRKPFILKIMDRSFLGLKRLSIMDFKLYLGDMYILDYHQGLLRFDITAAQQILIGGWYRTDSGFLRFGVYSSNLDNQFLIVLANNHAIYEIDWTNQIQPKIITKYSIMSNSWVNSISVNHKYVVVQAEANVTRTSGQISLYNMTWVFTRNSRLYTNAYAIINHDSWNTFIDFSRDLSGIMSIDEKSITLYEVDTPYLTILPTNTQDVDKQFLFNVNAKSINPVTGQSTQCFFTFKFVIVSPDSTSLWPTGITLPKQYYANYPGQLFIPLNFIVFGQNITYTIEESSTVGQLPNYWILQQNGSKLQWDKDPSQFGQIIFIRQQQYDSIAETDLYIYVQSKQNTLSIAQCTTEQFKQHVNCSIVFLRDYRSRLLNLTANRFHYYQGRYLHLAAMIFQNDPNTIVIINVQNQKQLWNLKVADGFAGIITSIEFTHGYLIAVLRYAKSIVVWDMNRCQDFGVCKPISLIDAPAMAKVGIKYFSPLQVVTSDFHPYIIFIQSVDRVVIIDFTKQGPLLIDVISSPATNQTGYWGWKIAVSWEFLVIVNAPNIIEEHSLVEMQSRKTFLTKRYPLYNYTLPQNFDLDFSDAGDMIYISAVEKNSSLGVVLVYRAGYPAVGTLYDVFNTNSKFDDIMIQVTGSFVDYVTILQKRTSKNQISIFRQYGIPILVFQNTFSDFSFNLTYSNYVNNRTYSSSSLVKIANYPVNIQIVNQKIKDNNYLNSLLNYKNDQQKYAINDHQWFNGTVLNYQLKCQQCGRGNKIQLIDHVYDNKDVIFSYGMYDIDMTPYSEKIVIQHFQNVIRLNHNGSIEGYISLPLSISLFGQHCVKISMQQSAQYFVSGCIYNQEVTLYLTSQISSKSFSMGPYRSSAQAIDSIKMKNKLLFLADVDSQPQFTRRPGSIIIYSLNVNPDEMQLFDEIQVIDSNDFTGIKDWDPDTAYLGGMDVVYHNQADLYRIYATQLYNGFFIIDFKWVYPRTEINVIKTNFINLKNILIQQNLPIPNAASFQGITILQQRYDNKTQNWNIDLIVSVRNFHNFHINLMIDRTGSILYAHLAAVYYRYSFYQSTTYIKSFDGYFVNSQKLPSVFQQMNFFTPQIIAVYDTRPNRTQLNEKNQQYAGNGVPAYHMMGGLRLNDTFHTAYAFNLTRRRNQTDPFSDIGLVAIDSSGQYIRQISLSQSLHIITHPHIKKSQTVSLIAQNDYSKVQLPIKITIHHGINSKLPGWAIALIVIGSVAAASGIGFGVWYYLKLKKSKVQPQIKKSLLQQEADQNIDEQQQDGQQNGSADGQGQTGEIQDIQGDEVQKQQQTKGTEVTTNNISQGQLKQKQKVSSQLSRQGVVNESIAISQAQNEKK